MKAWGWGIDLIRTACRAAAKPEPVFRWDNGLWVEFILPVVNEPNETLGKRLDEKLGKNRAAIVRLMRTNPKITVTEIAKSLHISRTAADKNIQILKTEGYITRIGSAKGGQSQVKK